MDSSSLMRRYLTAKGTMDRLAEQEPIALEANSDTSLPFVLIDPSKRFQIIEGFGGAFSEAAACTLYRLGPKNRKRLLKAYFDPAIGHGYSLCRTHINSCDFALGNYAYTEIDGDVDLKHFSIDRDRQALLPMIREASRVAGESIKLLASPWSPPAWMKTNGQSNRGGKLKPEYRKAW